MASEVMTRPAASLVPDSDSEWQAIEQVLIKGDLSPLTAAQRVEFYGRVCRSLGLNPLTRPFEYLSLNNKLVLYAKRDATDQLRSIRGISVLTIDGKVVGDLYVATAAGRDRAGRIDTSTGVVNVKGVTGESLANAVMKAETKAKRRLTLSLAGLGFLDESEVGQAQAVDIDPTTAEIAPPNSVAEALAAAKARDAVAAPVQADVPGVDPSMRPDERTSGGSDEPTPEQTGELCDSRSPYDNPQPCSLLKGHQGNHRAETKESWR